MGSLTGWEAVSEEGGGLCQTCGVLHRLQMACVNNESWNLCWLLQQCAGTDFWANTAHKHFPCLGVLPYAQVSAGYFTTCALYNDGEIYCFGRGVIGQVRTSTGRLSHFLALT